MALVGQIGVLVGCDAPVVVGASAVPPRRARGREANEWTGRKGQMPAPRLLPVSEVFASINADFLWYGNSSSSTPRPGSCSRSSVTAAAKCERGLATGLMSDQPGYPVMADMDWTVGGSYPIIDFGRDWCYSRVCYRE